MTAREVDGVCTCMCVCVGGGGGDSKCQLSIHGPLSVKSIHIKSAELAT